MSGPPVASKDTVLTKEVVKRAIAAGTLDQEKGEKIVEAWINIEKANETADRTAKDDIFRRKLGTLFGPAKMKEYFEMIYKGKHLVMEEVQRRKKEREQAPQALQPTAQPAMPTSQGQYHAQPPMLSQPHAVPQQQMMQQQHPSGMKGQAQQKGSQQFQLQQQPVAASASSSMVVNRGIRPQIVNPPFPSQVTSATPYNPNFPPSQMGAVGTTYGSVPGKAGAPNQPAYPYTYITGSGSMQQSQINSFTTSAAGMAAGAGEPLLKRKREGEPDGDSSSNTSRPAGQAEMAPADEIQALTERPNLQGEGIEIVDKSVNAPLLGGNAFMEEEQRSKALLRSYNDASSKAHLQGTSAQSLSHGWQYFYLADRTVVNNGLVVNASSGGLKLMSAGAQQLLSEALQLHFRTIIEASIGQSKRRVNQSSFDTFRNLFRTMHTKAGGNACEDNLGNIALKWGPPVAEALKADEDQAIMIHNETMTKEEQVLREQMMESDEDRARSAGVRRKSGPGVVSDADQAWWLHDDTAERRGLLNWEQLADSSLRADIAAKYHLGPALRRKQVPSLPASGPVASSTEAYRPSAQYLRVDRDNASSLPDPDSRWQAQKCPVKMDTRSNMVVYEDVLASISRSQACSLSSSGDRSLTEPLGRSLARWKLNVNSI